MKTLLTKYRRQILQVLTLLFAIMGFMELYFLINITSKTNDECLWVTEKVTQDSSKIVFKNVKINGVTWNAGIRNGDEFLKINGKKLRNINQATYIADSKEAGDTLVYTYSRNGKIYESKIPVKKIIWFSDLAFVVLGLIWLAVGFIVVSSKPFGRTQLLFYKIGVYLIMFAGVVFFKGNNNINPIWQSDLILLILDFVWIYGAIFSSFSIVQFFLIFPKESSFANKKIFHTVFTVLPIALLILAMIFRIVFLYYPKSLQQSISVYNLYFTSYLSLAFLSSTVIGLISLTVKYFKIKERAEKKKIFTILLFYTFAVLSIVYLIVVANSVPGGMFNHPEYFLPIFLVILLPIGFGYSIFKYSLMDVSDVLKNTILYGAATFLLAGVYFLLMYLIGQTISEAITEEYQGLVAGVIFVMFAFVFQSTKDKFQNVITKYFYPEQFAYEQVLLKFSNDISTTVGLDNILDSVESIFVEGLKVNKFGILLKEKNSSEFILKRESGFKNKSFSFTDKFNAIENAVEKKLELKLPVAFDNVEFKNICPDKTELLEEENIYTIIPLVINKRTLGLLLFGLKHSGAQFTGNDIELLIATANQTAVAIENARLYEAEATKIKLERDLDVAREIQESMLPKVIPQFKNVDIAGTMIPAMQVGGDYFDVIKISETQFYIVVADVSGKGLSASFYMSKLQTMIQLFCKGGKAPKEVLTEVNRKLSGNIEKKWFITLTVAFIDSEKKTMLLCRAGHTPTIKFSKGKIEYLKPRGLAVGLEFGKLFENTLEEIELRLVENDIYFFTSDGVSEAMNNSNELFGDERIAGLLKANNSTGAENLLETTLNALEKFRGSKEPNDDVTIVVLKII